MRKHLFTIIVMSALAALPAGADTVLAIHLEEGDSLGAFLDDASVPDSLVISGVATARDILDLRDYISRNGTVRGVNFLDLNLPDNRFPGWSMTIYRSNTSLKHITLPRNLEGIGTAAFMYLEHLETVDIPEGLTYIEPRAFFDCQSLRDIRLPDGLKSIGHNAFVQTRKLTSIVLPASLRELGEYAFMRSAISGVITVPEGIDTLRACTFEYCNRLKKVVLPDGLKVIGGFALSGTAVETIDFPLALDSIGPYAFSRCRIEEVSLPESVRYIDARAFDDCASLRSVMLSAGLDSISPSAFSGCSALRTVRSMRFTPPGIANSNVMDTENPHPYTPGDEVTLYVPKGAAEAYRSAEWWQEFKHIVEVDVTAVSAITPAQSNADNRFYRPDGTVAKSTTRGLYIHNGRKVVVR